MKRKERREFNVITNKKLLFEHLRFIFLGKKKVWKVQSLNHGSPEVEARSSPEEEEPDRVGHPVQLSVLQSREVVRGQDGQDQKHREDPVYHLHGGFSGKHELRLRSWSVYLAQ
jgi:hypothetical protein